jgi:hypothetical protein
VLFKFLIHCGLATVASCLGKTITYLKSFLVWRLKGGIGITRLSTGTLSFFQILANSSSMCFPVNQSYPLIESIQSFIEGKSRIRVRTFTSVVEKLTAICSSKISSLEQLLVSLGVSICLDKVSAVSITLNLNFCQDLDRESRLQHLKKLVSTCRENLDWSQLSRPPSLVASYVSLSTLNQSKSL